MPELAWWGPWSVGASVVPVLALAVLHGVGWWRLHRRDPQRWGWARPSCFLAGLAALAAALWSPLDERGQLALSSHMTQHLLLSMVAPPLLLLGWPFMPIMHGLPRWISVDLLGPLMAWPGLRRLLGRLVHPTVAWPTSVVATWAWHLPPAYEWALSGSTPHAIEHACFLWSGVMFWWPVVAPWPWQGPWPRWSMAFYLLLADVANTVVAGLLAFAPGVVYGTYALTSPAIGVDPLDDQRLAAVIMWLPGQLAFLVPAVVILATAGRRRAPRSIPLPLATDHRRRRFDLLAVPLIGDALRRPWARLAIRAMLLVVALIVVADGLFGPEAAATNVAGTWPWTHWRGLAAIGAVVAGNLACMSCPLIAPRTVLRRWIRPRWRWPAGLRMKWIAAALVLSWLIAYEALGWWDSPRLTAGLVIGLVVAATVIDLLFEGAAFCRWVCPIGQWNMAMSVASPLQVQAKDPAVCLACRTQDCLRGGPAGPGCGTDLFVPRKEGSLECTMCLDCVTACPHGNVAVGTAVPLREIVVRGTRSAIGRWTDRVDFATLLMVLGAGGVANAMVMTEPLVGWVDGIGSSWPRSVVAAIVTLGVTLTVAALPAVAALVGGRWRERWCGLAIDLWPLGVAMWLAHFGFHLFSGWASALPPLQRAASDGLGLDLGEPRWVMHCCAVAPAWLVPAMLVTLGVGFVASLGMAWRRSCDGAAATRVFLADACVATAWWAMSAWIVLQPMQMRGLLG